MRVDTDCRIFQSIRETAKSTGLAECYLRKLVKENKAPGFHSGKKFNINVPALLERLEQGNG